LNASNPLLARFILSWSPRLAPLTRVPVLGGLLHWVSTKAIARDVLVWLQIKNGVGAGLWLRVNPRTGQQILGGSAEPKVQQVLAEHLRPGMVFYDLGANIGFFTLIAARLVGREGRVFSFEADPELAARLRRNVERNNFAWVTVEEKAIWSTSGPLQFHRADPTASPDRGLGFVTTTPVLQAILVEGVTLDSCIRTLPAPDLIKCDVEGAEVEVMRGARELLHCKRPKILCEFHSEQIRASLISELSSSDYDCQLCDENHILALPK
jgi:FkbM family methyltransferase